MRAPGPVSLLFAAGLLPLPAQWLAMGGNAQVKEDGKAVVLEYKIEPGQLGMAAMPAVNGELSSMKSIRFRVKTDRPTPVAVVLSETRPGGGDYAAVVWSPGDTWQPVELTPRDFALNDGPNDAKDADGKLDLDQLQGLAVLDVGQMFAGYNLKMPIQVDKRSGKHTLRIEDFQILNDAPVDAPAAGVAIDSFDRKQLNWFTLGGMELEQKEKLLEVRYQQSAASFQVLMRRLPTGKLAGMSKLVLDLASQKPAHLIIALERVETGARYNYTVDVAGGKELAHKEIPFREFEIDGNSRGKEDGGIDPAKVKSIVITDLQGMISGQKTRNILQIGPVFALP